MKTVSLIFILVTFTLNVISQTTEKVVYQEKGETETYEIRKGDKSKFIYRAEISFEKVASPDVAGKHSHNVALLYALIHCLDSTREDPWMKTLERLDRKSVV